MLHRLARHAQLLRDLFLNDSFARFELARRNFRHDGLADLFGKIGLGGEHFHGK